MASKLDAYKDLLGDMTDEKLVELTGLKLATVKAYRAKHDAELEKAINEVAELTGTDPGELEEAPAADVAEEAAREIAAEVAPPERIPYSFSTTQTINIPGPRGRVQKIGKSIFRGERAASVWAQLSPEDREKRTAGHCYEPPKGGR